MTDRSDPLVPSSRRLGLLGSSLGLAACLAAAPLMSPQTLGACLALLGLALLLVGWLARAAACLIIGVTSLLVGLSAWAFGWLCERGTLPLDPSRQTEVVMGLILLGSVLAAAAVGVYRYRTGPRPVLPWRCRRCGYALVGITEPLCPECGQPLDPRQILQAPPGLYRFQASRPAAPDDAGARSGRADESQPPA